jgi:hypothetical protein
MKEKVIDIKAESFPWQMRVLGALLLLPALGVMASLWWLSILLIVLGVFLLTGYSGTEVDVSARTFREYNSYLFIRTGEKIKYDRIERIFINRAKVTQKMYTAHTNSSSTFQHIVYNAYLKVDDEKIFLTRRKSKEKLVALLNPVAAALKTELVDHAV